MNTPLETQIQIQNPDSIHRLLVQSITDYAIYLVSLDGIVLNWNPGAERVKGYRAEEIVGQHFSVFYSPQDRANMVPQRALAVALRQGKFEEEGWRVRRDGSRFRAHVTMQPVQDDAGKAIGFAEITVDLTVRKKSEDEDCSLARYDALTGFLSRASFQEFAARELHKGKHCVLLSLYVDRLKLIRDTLGHLAGDKVLQVVAERMAQHLRKIDVVGRIGGDEFAVLLVDCEDERSASAVSECFVMEIGKPIALEGVSVSVGVRIGMAPTGDQGVNLDTLLRNADLALYAAKRGQLGNCRWYDPSTVSMLVERMALEDDLRLALINNEFFLNYQPIFNASGKTVMGFEALIRWKSPTRGMVPPVEFISFAESTGLMVEIGDWVLRTACAEAARWSEKLALSINLSTSQLRSEKIVERIDAALASNGLPASRLEIEITESSLMEDMAGCKIVLDELHAMGLMLALDNFGTGYSSFNAIRTLPFTRIKIDRSLIDDMGRTKETLSMVRAIVGLCISLGVAVTAEGIETEAQLEILQEVGCHGLQGYLLGRPAPYPERNGVRIDQAAA